MKSPLSIATGHFSRELQNQDDSPTVVARTFWFKLKFPRPRAFHFSFGVSVSRRVVGAPGAGVRGAPSASPYEEASAQQPCDTLVAASGLIVCLPRDTSLVCGHTTSPLLRHTAKSHAATLGGVGACFSPHDMI